MPRGMRFGLCTDQNLPFATLVERWQHFERLGFDSVWDCDHFNQPSRPTGPYYEGWTLLAALAARTATHPRGGAGELQHVPPPRASWPTRR